MRLLRTLGLFLALLHLSTSLLLGAFNIKSFGRTKAANPTVMNHITTIVRRYDIILIQEVRDTDLSATKELMKYVNKPTADYSYVVSDPLGPGIYKERYLFLYRHQLVNVADNYTYTPKGIFSREPFIVRFTSQRTNVTDFALIPQHTSPSHAVREIDALYDVVTDVNTRWTTNNIVLLGDFNAGCSYMKAADKQKIRLFTKPGFNWLIGDQVDTTVSHSNCPYDRIVATNAMMTGVVQSSARVYDYEVALGLNRTEAAAVSDHFPVEVQLN